MKETLAIIFGASFAGEEAYKELKDVFDIKYFTDNNQKKWESYFCGLKVLEPAALKIYNNYNIIIANKYYHQIKDQLITLGLTKIYYFDSTDYERALSEGKKDCRSLFLYPIYPDNVSDIEAISEPLDSNIFHVMYEKRRQIKGYIRWLLKHGNLKEAEIFINDWAVTESESPDICLYYALLEKCRGNLDIATEYLNNGLKQQPYHVELLSELSSLGKQPEKTLHSRMYVAARLLRTESTLRITNRRLKQDKETISVLHAPYEISHQPSTYCEGLKRLGLNCMTIDYIPDKCEFNSDEEYCLARYGFFEKYYKTREIAARVIPQYDIFHFHYGMTLIEENDDIEIIQELGKKIVMNYWGSDIRIASIAKTMCPNMYVNGTYEDNVRRRTESMGKRIRDCIVPDYELYAYVKDYYEHVHLVRQAINMSEYEYKEPERKHGMVKILHAPTNRKNKGTEEIIRAIAHIKQKYAVEFILAEGYKNKELMKLCADADIIINALGVGAFGIFALESMAMGKPVLSEISPYMKEHYPSELPIVNITKETIEEQLIHLIEDVDDRINIGKQSREYVAKYHDSSVIAKQLLGIYRKLGD